MAALSIASRSDTKAVLGHPLSWTCAVEKFNCSAEPFAAADLRENIIEAIVKIDERTHR